MTQSNTKTKPTAPTAPLSKRLVFVTGDKGGVGKSAFARLLLDIYRHRKVDCQAIDSDISNPDLYRFYKGWETGVDRVDFTNRGEADFLIDRLAEQKSIILIDLPARSKAALNDFVLEMDLVGAAHKAGYQLTVVSVLSKSKNSIAALKSVIDTCGKDTNYIAVKNLFFGDASKFNRYDDSQTRKKLLEFGGIEILMPELFYTSWDAIENADLPFRTVADLNNDQFLSSIKSRTNRWLTDMETALQPAHEFLGLN